MSIDRALQWTTAGVAIVGALFLAIGHDSGWLPMLLGLAAALSVLGTDLFPWLRLNRILANLVAISAVVWSLYDFLARTSDQQLMAISQMLVFLQVLLLFQEKTGRTYWQLLVLSLLQVVVAAALNTSLEFGLLLVAYMVLSLLALVLLCLHRDLKIDEPAPTQESILPAATWESLLAPPEVAPASPPGPEGHSSFRFWLLARKIAALATATAAFTSIYFYVTPRLNDNAWQTIRRGSPEAGAGEQVVVEQKGRIHQSNQIVLRALFTDANDRTNYSVIGDPYFQGSALTHYANDESGSRWYYVPRQVATVSNPPRTDVRPPPASAVRQDYVLEFVGSPWAFAVFPIGPIPGERARRLRFDRAAGRLVSELQSHPSQREYRYAFLTTGFKQGRQVRGVPHANAATNFEDAARLTGELDELRQFDSRKFPGIEAVATRAITQADLQNADPLTRAQALERHLATSELYQYSLDLNFQRDLSLDPLEDFVVNHRLGHCEYFASALVMMLRSQGIPARMVVGYKGGEYNMLGHYYVVRQKHAHAWVEAWMPPGSVPDSEIAGVPHAGGCWYRLDPTPASSDLLVASDVESLRDRITDAFDYVELMWRDYVVNLNSLRQQEAVIDPAAANTFGALPGWIDTRPLERWFREFGAQFGWSAPRGRPRVMSRIFDWRYAALVVCLLIAVIGLANLVWSAARFGRRVIGWDKRPGSAACRPPRFYRRLEGVLARLRLRRAAGQTPRELAGAAGIQLAGAGEAEDVAELPDEIVQAYYRVRFGGATLDNREALAIEQALAKLVPAVSQARQR